MERACQPLDHLETRFWSEVRFGNGCWEWAGASVRGYGRYAARAQDRERLGLPPVLTARAHRVAWALWHREPAGPSHVLHACDNPLCVKPSHLWLGSHSENMADMVRKGRAQRRRGEESPRAKLTADQARAIRAEYSAGATQRSLAVRHGVAPTTIWRILRAEAWPGLGPPITTRREHVVGERAGLAKLTAAAVRDIRRRRAAGVSCADLARHHGVSDCVVSRVARGLAWAHVR